jgi:hypothetical protein
MNATVSVISSVYGFNFERRIFYNILNEVDSNDIIITVSFTTFFMNTPSLDQAILPYSI